MSTIIPDFAPYFRSRHVPLSGLAEDERVMRSIHSLRFQVYCLECGFLQPAEYPDGLEVDACDPISHHFATFNLRDELVGYVRLVGPDAQGLFPFQTHGAQLFDNVQLPPPGQAAEISRLMVRLPLEIGVHKPIIRRQVCTAPPASAARTASG